MVREFFDKNGKAQHEEFQDWRSENQDGVFLALSTRTKGRLHGARCSHLGSGPPYFSLQDGFGSLTISRKVCGTEIELSKWASANGVFVARCQHCLRDGLISNGPLEFANPEEVSADRVFQEGHVQQILVNRFERDPRARKECLTHHGTICCLCKADFALSYGPLMAGFIHVHHLKPLSQLRRTYTVDPVNDLVPVCPNCHAVLHRRDPPYSLDEVREFLKTRLVSKP